MSPSKTKSPKKAGSRRRASGEVEQRLARLEKWLDLVLQASLRGRLMPNERRSIKRYLEQRKAEQRQSAALAQARARAQEGPRCPACRLPIPDEKAERCPHCSVLLAVARRSRRKRS